MSKNEDENVLCVRPTRLAECGLIGQGFIPLGHEIQMFRFLDGCQDFIPRSVCETDEAWRQVIPYIVGVSADEGIFTYVRDSKGTEGRLHHRRSLGIGGHVAQEDAPNGGRKGFMAALRREIKEEVIYEKTNSLIMWLGIVNDVSDPVGRVHLGIVGALIVRDGPILPAPGNDHFRDCKCMSYSEVMMVDDWENWSSLVSSYILGRPNLWAQRG